MTALQANALKQVYLVSTGAFLPGPPIANDQIDRYIAPINRFSARIKNKTLDENGIRTRHYGIDEAGRSRFSIAALAAHAIRDCLRRGALPIEQVTLLCTGASGGDVVLPGFANMVQGELGLHPVETSSHQGVCASGVGALQYAYRALRLGHHEHALVVAAEYPSRLFKQTRFLDSRYNADFDSHFLRWMLSDGAGAWLLSNQPRAHGLSLHLKWVHLKSFSGDFPVCMQVGFPEKNAPTSYLDYASLAEAERQGAFFLRQNIRLLPQLFEVGIHEYARLAREGQIDPARVDHLLCHYSSEKFAPVVEDLLERSGMAIPRSRWYSNLTWRGNTGAASIFIMLADFLDQRTVEPGRQILCFVPESGRFTVGFSLFEVVSEAVTPAPASGPTASVAADAPYVPPPAEAPENASSSLVQVLRDLSMVWHDYRSRAWRTALVQRIIRRQLTRADYVRWMACWIPQVREGSKWMRRALSNMGGEFKLLCELIEEHAGDEQFDFRILFEDYQAAGGTAANIDELARNSGGEALNAYMYGRAAKADPVDLLGAIYIIEGTGQRIIPALLPLVKEQLDLPPRVFRFLAYHGENDARHLARWLDAVGSVVEREDGKAHTDAIVATARNTAQLYLMQMEEVL